MCGIAGWLGSQQNGQQYATRMARALNHRGPDAHGIQSCPGATLVHTRLSILDLSPAGAQPMANEDGTIWTVFNGEIYNHRELRRHLQTRGHDFRGRSDSEVIPHLYEEDGPTFVSKLRGMFALAIFDTRTKTLLLARDRFGIKPLFYAAGDKSLAFASEINALLQLPAIDRRPDRQAVYDFAALLYIPAPETFYIGIRAIQPGEMVEARLDGDEVAWKARTYHQWSIAVDSDITLEHAADRADELVKAAVGRQVESDVPIGAFLSGGIDSSLVSAGAQAALNGGLRTFNARFSDKEYDETWAALSVAKHIDSDHTALHVESQGGTWAHIADLLLHAGQPFADTSLFAVNAVCRLMRKHVTVALSGDGGDEGFGGYNTWWRIGRIARLKQLPSPFWHIGAAVLTPLARAGLLSASWPDRMNMLTASDDTSTLCDLTCWVREEELSRLCIDHGKALPLRRLFQPQWEYHLPPTASRLEWLSAYVTEITARLSLPNDYLFKVDTASMKESLEVRVPLLDEDLFGFGLSLPHHLKVKGRVCKRILRAVADRRLPSEVAHKPKVGFGIPVDTWVDADFKAQLREVLLGPSSRLPEFFRPEAYRPAVEAFCEGRLCRNISRQGLYQRVIMLLAVQLTMDAATP